MCLERHLRVIYICVLLTFSFGTAIIAEDSDFKKDYKLGMTFGSDAGIASSRLYEFVDTIMKVLNEEYDYNIKLKKYGKHHEILDALLANEIDAGAIGSSYISRMIESGDNIRPWITFTFGGNRKQAYCVWHRKKDTISKPGDLIGKTTTARAKSTNLRWFLAENGLDMPLYDVFETFTDIPGSNSAFIALAVGKIDVLWASDDEELFMNFMNPGIMKKIDKSLCTENLFARAGIVMNLNTVSEADLKHSLDTLGKVQKDLSKLVEKYPELQTMIAYMKMIEIRMAPATEDEYDFDIDYKRKIEKESWRKEKEIIGRQIDAAPKGSPVKIMPSFEFCKDRCTNETTPDNESTCIVECME